jgi:hypothetical protein
LENTLEILRREEARIMSGGKGTMGDPKASKTKPVYPFFSFDGDKNNNANMIISGGQRTSDMPSSQIYASSSSWGIVMQ